MKKLFLLLLTALILFISVNSWAAGTVTCTDYLYNGLSKKSEIRVVTYSVTFGSDASSPANVALDSIVASSYGSARPSLSGWWLLRVDYLYGATGPTDDSDLYLWKSYGENRADVLGGTGVDQIDNATDNIIYPDEVTQPLTGAEIFDIDNNAVNDATCTIVFTLYR